MTKEQYIVLRNNNSIELLYEYYKEKFNNKHKFLTPDLFFQTIVQWPPVNDAYKSVIAYFDVKFEITKVQDLATGETIKCI